MKAGIYYDISAEEYHADKFNKVPSLSSSIANLIVGKSAAHAKAYHPRLDGFRGEDTDPMDNGSLLHALLLGEEDRIQVVDAKDWRTKVAKEAKKEARAAGKTPVLESKFKQTERLADRLRGKFLERGYDLRNFEKEVTLFWEETCSEGRLVRCKARVDLLEVANGTLLDLKSTANAGIGPVGGSFLKFGYDVQHSAYVSAFSQLVPELAGRVSMDFLFFECSPPYAVTPVTPDGTMRELGALKWQRAVDVWSQCLHDDVWPEYTSGPGAQFVSAPMWALREEGLDAEG